MNRIRREEGDKENTENEQSAKPEPAPNDTSNSLFESRACDSSAILGDQKMFKKERKKIRKREEKIEKQEIRERVNKAKRTFWKEVHVPTRLSFLLYCRIDC
jgi:hypothetical protein